MRITSQPGDGTTVELWLPVCRRRSRSSGRSRLPAATPVEEIRSCRVLVVDDDPLVVAGTAAMLEDLGHVATEARPAMRRCELLRLGHQHRSGDHRPRDARHDRHRTGGAHPATAGRNCRSSSPPVMPNCRARAIPALPRLSKPYRQQDLAAPGGAADRPARAADAAPRRGAVTQRPALPFADPPGAAGCTRRHGTPGPIRLAIWHHASYPVPRRQTAGPTGLPNREKIMSTQVVDAPHHPEDRRPDAAGHRRRLAGRAVRARRLCRRQAVARHLGPLGARRRARFWKRSARNGRRRKRST